MNVKLSFTTASSRISLHRRLRGSRHRSLDTDRTRERWVQGKIWRHGPERRTRICAGQERFRGTGRDVRNRAQPRPKPSASAGSATLTRDGNLPPARDCVGRARSSVWAKPSACEHSPAGGAHQSHVVSAVACKRERQTVDERAQRDVGTQPLILGRHADGMTATDRAPSRRLGRHRLRRRGRASRRHRAPALTGTPGRIGVAWAAHEGPGSRRCTAAARRGVAGEQGRWWPGLGLRTIVRRRTTR